MSELPSNAEPAENKESQISMQTFLEEVASNQERLVSDFAAEAISGSVFTTPNLTLFCSHKICGRRQTFTCTDTNRISINFDGLLHYECRNCGQTKKTFAIRAVHPHREDVRLLKIGEQPAFGPPLPARLQRLVQSERDFLVKGYQSEIHGQGIGAFAYYRRVVEEGKDRLIDEIIEVCKKTSGADKFINELEEAKKEVQFKKAVERIADSIPEALLISGQNPLTLLHQAISKSLHSDSDEECLEAAQAIRAVLGAFTERLSQLLKDDVEVTKAVKKLLASKNPAQAQPT